MAFDFAEDRPFPESASKKREFGEVIQFEKSGVVVIASGENEFGGSVDVSRRGPGGLGVVGNGDRNAAGEGTTSGNRINNGEHLILTFSNSAGEPVAVNVNSVVFDRIVRDDENFADSDPTGYQLLADGKMVAQGELIMDEGDSQTGPLAISLGGNSETNELRITTSDDSHPIANRFRISGLELTLP